MLVCNPDEIVIHGTTSKGKTFRPSDWSERLCGILSSFDKGNRLSYHQWVRPILVDNVRSVAVDKQLEEINPAMFRFLMDFAADNDLRVLDCKTLLSEKETQETVAEVAAPKATPVPVVASETVAPSVESVPADGIVLREIAPVETSVAFAALSILRPALTDVNRFIEQVNSEQRATGYRLLGIFEEGKNNAVAVCGFRVRTTLSYGKHIVIEDIVTVPQSRRRGFAQRLLQEIANIAAAENIAQIHADALVGNERIEAHRMYYRYGFEINAHHFVCKTEQFGK
ncbi:MAG: GNAT family N-acetyltransferase [Neisseria sp.]|nr:GNAT family N-acetyltransferase [Neisseria sp.]